MNKINIKKGLRLFFLALAIVAVPLFSGCGSSSQSGYLVNLEIWGIFDDSTDYSEIINQYKNINPYVGEIRFKKFSQNTYRQELLDALASGQGPDIFMINNSWLPFFENKIDPAPGPFMNEQDLKTNFPDVVASDFMDNGKVYAAPLTIDSMQLFYNRDLFNAAGIANPPKTWQEFNDDVAKLTVINNTGQITQSGGAIGTGNNINRSPDLLSLLMIQNGVQMPSTKGETARFDEGVPMKDGTVVMAGEQALDYYTRFAKIITPTGTANPLYTWNSKMHNSLDAFAEGSVAMMFNYSWQVPTIKSKNAKLNFSVAPVPQVDPKNPATIANYWAFAVSLNKLSAKTNASTQVAAVPNDVRMHEAWQFLKFMTLKNSGTVTLYNAVTKNSKDFAINFDPALDYLKKTQQPAARRDLIDLQKSDATLGVFAAGNLIAKHWYESDPENIDGIFNQAIDSVVNGTTSVHEALSLAKNRVNYLGQGL